MKRLGGKKCGLTSDSPVGKITGNSYSGHEGVAAGVLRKEVEVGNI